MHRLESIIDFTLNYTFLQDFIHKAVVTVPTIVTVAILTVAAILSILSGWLVKLTLLIKSVTNTYAFHSNNKL